MKRLMLTLTAAAALGLPTAPALAATQPPAHPCAVRATATSVNHVEIATVGTGCIAPQVTVQAWLSPSADGRPLNAQRLLVTGFDGLLQPGARVQVLLESADLARGCMAQVDVAYGHARADLSTPYGSDLIAAWHVGTTNCLTPPTTTPPPSSPPASSPPATTPPASSPPTSSPVPSATVTLPPVVTTAPPTTGPATPTPTLVPPVHLTKTPTPKPSRTHKPRPTPTATRTTPAPSVSASGCVGDGCDTPPPSAAPQLPYTGTPPALMYELLIGSAALVVGLGLIALTARRKS